MAISEELYYAAQAGFLVAMLALAAGVVFTARRARRRRKNALWIFVFSVGVGVMAVALGTESVACPLVSSRDCVASDDYGLKVQLLWAGVVALLASLAWTPRRRDEEAG